MATNDEIIAKLPLALVELRKQNKDAATKAAEDRAKEFEVLVTSRDALVVGSDERKAMNSELAKMRNQDSRKEAREKEAAASTAGQAIALKKELEEQGKTAEDNKGFQKLSFKARKEDFKQRIADSDSPAAKKQIKEDMRNDAKKNGSRLDKIGAGIGGLFEMGKKGLKTAALGGMALLSTLAIGGLMIALGKFLQSDTFKDMTKYIKETILPKLMEFWNFLKDNWEEIAIAIGSVAAVLVILKIVGILKKVKIAITAIQVGFIAVKAFMSATLLPAVTAFMVPLLPIIAIAAAVGVVLYALWNAFEDFCKTLNETGSIGEALKAGISKFIGTIVGFIPMLVLKLVSWVAGMFGFDDFASQVDAIDPIEWITDAVSCLVSDVVDWFIKLFNDPVAAINQLNNLVKGYIGVLIDFAGFIYKKAIKPVIDWVGCLFGVEDASGQMEGYIGKKLDKVINFAEEMYNKYIKPIVDWVTDWFNKAVADAKSSPTGQMISGAIDTAKNFVKTALQTILPDPSGGWTSIEGVAAKAIPKFIYEYAGMDPKTGALSESRSGELPSMRNATKAEKAEFDALSSSPPSKVIANATAMNSDNGSAKVSAMEAAATASVKRDAVGAGGGSGGPINNVDARQSSNVTTTGSSGQSPIIFQKFGKLNMRSSEGV